MLPSGDLESATRVNPFAQKESLLVYGPFSSLPAFAPSEVVTIHFSSIAHFITFDRYCIVSLSDALALSVRLRCRTGATWRWRR